MAKSFEDAIAGVRVKRPLKFFLRLFFNLPVLLLVVVLPWMLLGREEHYWAMHGAILAINVVVILLRVLRLAQSEPDQFEIRDDVLELVRSDGSKERYVRWVWKSDWTGAEITAQDGLRTVTLPLAGYGPPAKRRALEVAGTSGW